MTYTSVGKQVLCNLAAGGTVHIADATNNENAHAIATYMNTGQYISDAKRTLSPSWHGDKVAKHLFVGIINSCIKAANDLDKVKKTLFYGRDNNLNPALGQSDISSLPSSMVMPVGADAANVIHAILGKFTEAGELLEALKACMNGEAFDRVNAVEEIGDGFWYDAILLDEMASDFMDAQRINIAKLRARFPDKFEAVQANERDLTAERAILEDRNFPLVDDETTHVSQPLDLIPSIPASGKTLVEHADLESQAAFAKLAKIEKSPETVTSDLNGELAKSPAERDRLPAQNFNQRSKNI